jgi:hypothetical protein
MKLFKKKKSAQRRTWPYTVQPLVNKSQWCYEQQCNWSTKKNMAYDQTTVFAFPNFPFVIHSFVLSSSGSGTGSTQPREVN